MPEDIRADFDKAPAHVRDAYLKWWPERANKASAHRECPSTTFVTTFGDAPLTDITATAKSEATTGGSQTTITCKDSNGVNVGNSPQGPAGSAAVAANGLKPGTYTCILVVDP